MSVDDREDPLARFCLTIAAFPYQPMHILEGVFEIPG